MENIILDPISERALSLMRSGKNVMLTGNAGTGKTTLLKYHLQNTKKRYAVVAPTGVAAVNAGGQTIHSFFSFPGRPVGIDQMKNLINYPDAYHLFKRLDGIIIDEISMVRADMMDQIFNFLKKNFPGAPFGGKQIIVVGDLDQLPPVVGSDEERDMIQKRYAGNEFFFAANCWKSSALEIVKLEKVHRQADPIFVDLLNRIKNNQIIQADISYINCKCFRETVKPEDGVVLCSTNARAQIINNKMLERLTGGYITLNGKIEGDFNPKNCPVESVINLKIGARVMTMTNDPEGRGRFVNGSIGILTGRDEESGALIIDIDGRDVRLEQKEFESIKYTYDKEKDDIKHVVAGKFVQYPIKLAYAMTIHKSQGKTFDKIIVDMGRGAFAHGQVYVALSRCRSLEGVSLNVPIKLTDLIYNDKILQFNASLSPVTQ